MNKVDWDYVAGFWGADRSTHGPIVFYNCNRRVLMEIQKFLGEHGIESVLTKRTEEWKRNIARLNDVDVANISDQYYLTVLKRKGNAHVLIQELSKRCITKGEEDDREER